MRKLVGILFCMILTVFGKNSDAQQVVSPEIDSLIKLSFSLPDTSKIDIYSEIAWETRYTNSILALEYGTMAMTLAEKYNQPKKYEFASVAVGTVERTIGNYEEAIRIYNLGLKIAKQNGFREDVAYSYNNLGSVLTLEDSLDKAELYLGVSLFMGNCLNNDDIVGYAEKNLATVQYLKGDYEKSLETCKEALQIRTKKINNDINKIYKVLMQMSECYHALGQTQKAKYILYNILKDNDFGKITYPDMLYFEMAKIYKSENNLDSALYFSEKCQQLRVRERTFEDNYKLLIDMCFDMKEYKKAAEYGRLYQSEKDSILQSSINNQNNEIQYTSEFYKEAQEYQNAGRKQKMEKIILVISIIAAFVATMFVFYIRSYNKKIKNINKTLRTQKAEISDSILYSQKIQSTMMPKIENFGSVFSDKFLLYMPRDIVSGDFYWHYETENYEMIAVADCTGHGVPGALLSMLGLSTLQECAKTETDPAKILEKLRSRVKEVMHQDNSAESLADGMDIALIKVDKNTKKLEYSGAFVPMTYIRNGEIMSLKPTQNPIGIFLEEEPYTTETLQLETGDRIYLLTDGYCSQLNGKTHKRMNNKHFSKLLLNIYTRNMQEQSDILLKTLKDWKGGLVQIDDITVAGFTV